MSAPYWTDHGRSCDRCGEQHSQDHECTDVCLAGNPARDGHCGDPDCVCHAPGVTEPPMDGMPWCEYCQCYHHETAEHITKPAGTPTGEFIDITPVGCQTPEGNARVVKAQQEWDSATHLLANTVKEIMEDDQKPTPDDIHQLRALIGARDRKQEAFLRAVAGR